MFNIKCINYQVDILTLIILSILFNLVMYDQRIKIQITRFYINLYGKIIFL